MSKLNNSLLENEFLVSVIITTYNRCDALVLSLESFGKQTITPDKYEVLVVDDGSTDNTWEVINKLSLSCSLRLFQQKENKGISAARNVAIKEAKGQYLVFVSDDLIVPDNFLAVHIATLEKFQGYWVVGGIQQLPSITETRFGKFLDELERGWEDARKTDALESGLWEMSFPTARNLSLPRADLSKTGLFDEQFRMSCEDQDLAHHAMSAGIRFLYNSQITCLHNDQVGDLGRLCRAQIPRTRDTALFCHKWEQEHGRAPVALVNGYISREDNLSMIFKKLIKSALANDISTGLITKLISVAERINVSDAILWKMYHTAIGLYMFRGWREGLKLIEQQRKSNSKTEILPSNADPVK